MKKFVSLLIAIILLSSALAGCDFSIIDNWMSNISTTTLTTKNESEIEWEEKVYWKGDINENFVPGEVIVVLDKAISELNKVHSKEFFVGVEIEEINDLTYRSDSIPHDVGNDFHQILSLTLFEKTKEAVVNAIKIIELITGVKGAQPNYIYEISSTTPNDPLYSFANNCDDQWGLEKINVEKVWDFTTGSCDVRVGVIDTGISLHNDLKNNYYFINGVEDYSNALDFFSSNNDTPVINVQDNHLHGTHVAGIIGAEGNNEEGISGVVWNVSLVQMRIGNYSFDTNSIVNALKWATSVWDTNARIDIINFSGEGDNPDLSFEIAIRDYCNKGGLFVCLLRR